MIFAKTDLLCLTETHLTPAILDSMIDISGFNVLRSDRETHKGGGVAVYYKKTLKIAEVKKPNISGSHYNFEYLPFDLTLSPLITARIICLYLPPISSGCALTIQNLCKVLSSLITPYQPFIILGDLNLPKINWQTSSAAGP